MASIVEKKERFYRYHLDNQDAYHYFMNQHEEEKAYAKNSEVMLTELIGKYYNEFITGKNTYPSYTENVNRNRIALIDAVTKGEYEDKKEISETYFYRTIRINEDYSLVMRTQLIPVSAVLDNSQGTYIILILIAALFSLILSIIFSPSYSPELEPVPSMQAIPAWCPHNPRAAASISVFTSTRLVCSCCWRMRVTVFILSGKPQPAP